jgi:hypothetical protein
VGVLLQHHHTGTTGTGSTVLVRVRRITGRVSGAAAAAPAAVLVLAGIVQLYWCSGAGCDWYQYSTGTGTAGIIGTEFGELLSAVYGSNHRLMQPALRSYVICVRLPTPAVPPTCLVQ